MPQAEMRVQSDFFNYDEKYGVLLKLNTYK